MDQANTGLNIMSEVITITQYNAAYIQLTASEGVLRELWYRFSFQAPNAKYDKRFKNRTWDGYVRLFSLKTRTVWAGLKGAVLTFANENRYSVEDQTEGKLSYADNVLQKFIDGLGLPEDITPHYYQFDALKIAAEDRRVTILSPTASGKSLIAYLIYRWFNKRTLIVVPTTTLVSQMAGDFAEYGYDREVRKVMAGANKENLPQVTVSTWQSIHSLPNKETWLKQFDIIIGDEAHGFNAPSLKSIAEALGATVRIGMTGSLDGHKVNEMMIEGIFGPTKRVATTKELIDGGFISPLKIDCWQLTYSDEVKKAARKSKLDYHDEMAFLRENRRRNIFIRELALRQKGNILILFKSIEHGQELHRLVTEKFENAHLIYGKVDTEERNEVRKIVENSENSITIASFKTFATGINIKRLHHVILASPIKSQILIVQSIGRSLRKGEGKTIATVHDIGDDMRIGEYNNHAYRHYEGRLELYTREQFDYRIIKVNI